MGKRVIAIAFSDKHWANWKQFNEDERRLKVSRHVIETIDKASLEYNVPILFSGDMIDHPKRVDNIVLEYLSDTISNMQRTITGINGNHDLHKVNSFKSPTKGYMHHLSKLTSMVRCIDFDHEDYPDFRVHGIPYINGEVDFIEALHERIKNVNPNRKNILLLHRDLAGAKEPNGIMIEKDTQKDKTLKTLFKKFDLVLSGHIHKPQSLPLLGKHVYMLGATEQQRRSDAKCKMGYWLIYDDMSLEFKYIKTPRFRFYRDEPENKYDYWIKLPQEVAIGKVNSGKFSADASRESLVKNYFKAKALKSKSKYNLALKYLNV